MRRSDLSTSDMRLLPLIQIGVGNILHLTDRCPTRWHECFRVGDVSSLRHPLDVGRAWPASTNSDRSELEAIMEQEAFGYGQRVRVHVPGLGDDGKVGTIKKVRNNRYYVHLDWDGRPQHLAMFYAADLERLGNEPVPTP